MKIKARCGKCGSSVEFDDDNNTMINEDGSADNMGRKFTVEVRSDEWQERHQTCLSKQITEGETKKNGQ